MFHFWLWHVCPCHWDDSKIPSQSLHIKRHCAPRWDINPVFRRKQLWSEIRIGQSSKLFDGSMCRSSKKKGHSEVDHGRGRTRSPTRCVRMGLAQRLCASGVLFRDLPGLGPMPLSPPTHLDLPRVVCKIQPGLIPAGGSPSGSLCGSLCGSKG